VTQEWCGCGSLEALVDANGNRTSWERDVQGRVTREVRANGSDTDYVYETKTILHELAHRGDGGRSGPMNSRIAALAAVASRSIWVRVIGAATAVGVSACSLALAPPSVIAGQRFPESELVRIQRGAPSDEVQRVGGAPFDKRVTEAGEVWRYFMRLEQREHVKFLGVIPLPTRRSVATFEVIFVMRNGVVSEVTSRDGPGREPRR
jgi:YD repeat-containing protein